MKDNLKSRRALGSSRLSKDAIAARLARAPVSPGRDDTHVIVLPEGARVTLAAVLIPLVPRGDEINVLLTQRTAHLKDHPSQISFPGGRVDPEDEDAIATALRETEEEIGLHRRHVEVIGVLPEYVTGTGFQVTPVVALVHPPFELTADEFEVAEIFEVPMSFLMDGANHQRRSAVLPSRPGRRSFYAMPFGDYFIWGATAAMLRNLYHFLRA